MARWTQTEEMLPTGLGGSRRVRGAAVVITLDPFRLQPAVTTQTPQLPGLESGEYLLDQAATMETVDVDGVALSPIQEPGRQFMTRCVGDGDASVLLVSGWTAPQEEWSGVQAKVGSVARVCSYDRLGIGESGPLPPRQTFETFASDIDILIDALELSRPVVIVGHSLGGPMAMTWASSHVTDTRGVAAEESTVFMPTDLPKKAPCEGVGGLSRQDQIAAVNVDLTPSASAMVRKAETDDAEDKKNVAVKKLRVASSAARRAGPASRKANARAVLLAGKVARKSGKQAAVRVASDSSTGGRTKSSRAAREL